MDKRIHNSGFLTALLGIFLLVALPVLCEFDYCCEEEEEVACSVECDAMCCAVAVCAASFDGLPVLDATFEDGFVLTSSLPQGVLPLPERPPITAC